MGTKHDNENLLNLWRGVIRRARQDYFWQPKPTTKFKKPELYRERKNAQLMVQWWLGTEDFIEVCRLADLNPDQVLRSFERE